jgi:hypothetical protein
MSLCFGAVDAEAIFEKRTLSILLYVQDEKEDGLEQQYQAGFGD